MRTVGYDGEGAPGLSPAVFKNMDFMEWSEKSRNGIYFCDDFCHAANDSDWDGWSLLTGDSGASVSPSPTEQTGALVLTTGATDNNEVGLQAAGGVGAQAIISDATDAKFALAFEARVKFGQITSHNWLIGLGEPGMQSANGMFTDGGALASKDFIGFRVLEGDSDELDFVFRKAGQSEVVIKNIAQTLVADTYYNIGFRYQPGEGADRQIAFFINGVEDRENYVTSTQIAASTFPDGEYLSTVLGGKTGAAASKTMTVDWVRLAQARESV